MSSDEEDGTKAIDSKIPLGDRKSLDLLFPLSNSPVTPPGIEKNAREEEMKTESHEDHLDVSPVMSGDASYEREQDSYNKKLQQRIDYFKDVFGAELDEEGGLEMEKTLISHALAYGPEQAAVYSREFAQGAAACCPNGCREERLHSHSLQKLEELEEELVQGVERSFYELTEAQDNNMQSERSASFNAQEQVRKNKGIPEVKSVDDLRLPSQYDVESQLYSRTPTKFLSQDKNHDAHPMVSFCQKMPMFFISISSAHFRI